MLRPHLLPKTVGDVATQVAISHLVQHLRQQHGVAALVMELCAGRVRHAIGLKKCPIAVPVIGLRLKPKGIFVALPKRNVAAHLKHLLNRQFRVWAFTEPREVRGQGRLFVHQPVPHGQARCHGGDGFDHRKRIGQGRGVMSTEVRLVHEAVVLDDEEARRLGVGVPRQLGVCQGRFSPQRTLWPRLGVG